MFISSGIMRQDCVRAHKRPHGIGAVAIGLGASGRSRAAKLPVQQDPGRYFADLLKAVMQPLMFAKLPVQPDL